MSADIKVPVDLINDASTILDHTDVSATLDLSLILISTCIQMDTQDAEVNIILHFYDVVCFIPTITAVDKELESGV